MRRKPHNAPFAATIVLLLVALGCLLYGALGGPTVGLAPAQIDAHASGASQPEHGPGFTFSREAVR